MIWKSINFWRIATFCLFIAVLALAFPHLRSGTHVKIESSSMDMVTSGGRYGALFRFTLSNDGQSGEAYVNFHAYLNERGGDQQDDYESIGVNQGETKSGEFFMPLVPGQQVHDWRIELT